MLDEPTYNRLVADAFKKLLAAVDRLDPDVVEADSTGDMVTIASPKGEKVVVNTQRAVRQLWVAGRSQGIHFSFDPADGRWKDDKGKGLELFSFVSECVQAAVGQPLPV